MLAPLSSIKTIGPGAAAGRLRPPAKFSWYPANLADVPDGPFRGLGKLQRLVLSLPRPRKVSATRFDDFRALGKLQRLVLTISEASESSATRFEPPEESEGAKITSNIPVT